MRKKLVTLLTLGCLVWALSPTSAQTTDTPKRPPRVFVGITVEPAAKDAGRMGVVVREVAPDSPAAKAGLKSGDVITKVSDKEVGDFDALIATLARHKPGDKLSFHVLRDAKEQSLTVTLGERTAGRAPSSTEPSREKGLAFLGVRTQELTAERKDKLGVSADAGAVVTEVLPRSPAAKAGLERGDVITRVDRRPVADPNELRAAIQDVGAGKAATLIVLRGREKKEFTAELEELPIDGLSMIPIPFPAPGGAAARAVTPAVLEAVEKVAELERKVQDLEKRLREVEKRNSPPK